MGDESFFDISPIQPSRIIDTAPWLTSQHQPNVQRPQTINQISNTNVNGGELRGVIRENASFPARPAQHYQPESGEQHTGNMDSWNPMDDDFACPTFNSYKNFDVLTAEQPRERSPEKNIRQSPEKRAEEISLYVGNIPLAISQEGVRNLFLAVGEVQSCKIFPPKDPSNDCKYGFVKFCTWREAIKAIETYNGFYVGSEKKLYVRVAHKKRNGGDFFSRDLRDEEYSSSDGAAQDTFVNGSYKSDNENTTDKNSNVLPELPTEANQSNSEQTTNEKLPNDAASKPSPAMPQAKLPCTCCEKLCTQRCSACKAPYCSRDCQKIDRARHKLVCTFLVNTKTPKPPSPTPAQIIVEEPQPDSAGDSDFDCIDISLDTSHMPRKETSKTTIALDSGHTSQKGNMVDGLSNAPRYEELDSDTGVVISQDQSPPSVLSDAQTWIDKEFVQAYVTAVSSANTFWACFRTPDYPRFSDMTNQLSEIREEHLEKITVATIGSLCLTRFTLDNDWYRSRITQGNAEHVEVSFVDYGNTEWKNIHDLYQLPPRFADVPPQAQQFILNGVTLTEDSEIEQRMVKYLDSLVSGKSFQVELVCSVPGCIPEVMIVKDAEQSINQQMVIYQEQQTSNVIGSRNGLDQPRFGGNMDTGQGELSETQPRQEIFQQGPVHQSYYPVKSHSSGNISANVSMTSSMTGYTPDYTSVNEPMSSCVPDNISINDPMACCGSYNIPPNDQMTGTSSGNTPCNTPMGGYTSNNISPNEHKTSCVPNKNLVSPHPNVGLKHYMALDVPKDILPSTKTFDILVCHFLTPTLFWIWFPGTAIELFKRLDSLMRETYEQSTYSDYQPLTGELIAAKFTDGVWYRASVDCFNYDGTLRVTFIDFGNSEDVSVIDIRRITDALAAIPRLSTKCALHGIVEPTKKWSAECLLFCKDLMLNKRGLAMLEINMVRSDSLALKLDMDIYGELRSVVDEIIKQGYFISEKLQISPGNKPAFQNSPSSKNIVSPNNQTVLPGSDRNKANIVAGQPGVASYPVTKPGQQNSTSNPKSHAPNHPLSQDSQNSVSVGQKTSLLPLPSVPTTAFKAKAMAPLRPNRQMGAFAEKVLKPAIMASGFEMNKKYEVFVSYAAHPTYFCAQHATPENLESIKRLQNVLNHHYNNNVCPPFKPEVNSLCVCMVSRNVWYRVYVRSSSPKGLLVYSVDFGFFKLVEGSLLRPLEEKFRSLPFGAMLFSMGNVKPLDGKIWTDETIEYFRKKVYSRVVKIRIACMMSRLFVDVYDPDSSEECLLNTALVTSGMAKEFQETSHSLSQGTGNETCSEVSLQLPLAEGSGSCDDQVFTAYDVPQEMPAQNNVPGFSSYQNPVSSTNVTHMSTEAWRSPNVKQTGPDQTQSPCSCSYQSPGYSSKTFECGNLKAAESPIPVVIPNESELDVFVWWVDSPHCIWVQHVVMETVELYAAMTDQMNAMCGNSSENVHNANVGDFCCVEFSGDWCRVKVEELLGNGLARVFYVDYGNRQDVELVKLKPLSRELRILPAQVLQCTLADVQMREGGWTPESMEWLKGHLLNKLFMASVVQRVDNVLHVRLYDKLNSDPNVSINSMIVHSRT